ncbi:MAG: hypothetical protein KF749_10850 [Bacteroidetes bacterium]|nr:hypothetical protein [Bacteroidota bacterium]MCW5895645.1 hypothetical protein [Bacteroidota bacterium]
MNKLGIHITWCLLLAAGCNVFEPREAEPPSQSGFQYLPRTFPSNVILNLQNSIGQQDVAGYVANFTDSTRSQHSFTFIPSGDAAEIYASVLRNWTLQQEQSYFQNLVAKRRQPQSFSNLTLIPKDSLISGDSRTYSFDYTLTFEHIEPGFTQTARGTTQFTLVNDNSEWTISRWVDLKTTNDLTWSSFKGKFSN